MSNLFEYQATILITTLGSEPQVVTLCLDTLLQQDEPIAELVMVHTDPTLSPIHETLATIRAEFAEGIYDPIKLTEYPLMDGQTLLPDVANAAQVDAAFEALYQLIWSYKRHNARIHLCIAGGRKTMAIFAFAVAQLLFDANDHIWHLESDEKLRKSRRLHATSEESVHLIEVPFTRWSSVPGAVRGHRLGETAHTAVTRQGEIQYEQERRQAKHFLQNELTRAEREAVAILVKEGLDNTRLAQRMHKSPKTITNQLSSAYAKFASFYGYPPEDVDRMRLIISLRDYI